MKHDNIKCFTVVNDAFTRQSIHSICPFKTGPRHRECNLVSLTCTFGPTNPVFPEICPLKNGRVELKFYGVDKKDA